MQSDIKFKYDQKKLRNIQAFMNGDQKVKIGILGNEWKTKPNPKLKPGTSPATLAATHEFGGMSTDDAGRKHYIPARPFLRMAMWRRRGDFIKEIQSQAVKIGQLMAAGDWFKILSNAGATWKGYVLDCFDQGGPGWKPLSAMTLAMRRQVWTGKYKMNQNGKREKIKTASTKILWETGAMARSITYKVEK
jgi:hypothetical protein